MNHVAAKRYADEPIREMRRMCYGLARRLTLNPHAVDDLASVGFFAMLAFLPNFREDQGNLEACLMTRARFAMIDELRRWLGRSGRVHKRPEMVSLDALQKHRDSVSEVDDENVATRIPGPGDVVAECAAKDELELAMRTVKSKGPRWLAMQHMLDGKTAAETAREMGLTQGRVSQIKQECVIELSRLLNKSGHVARVA